MVVLTSGTVALERLAFQLLSPGSKRIGHSHIGDEHLLPCLASKVHKRCAKPMKSPSKTFKIHQKSMKNIEHIEHTQA